MSYILDALKKSEQERGHGNIPSVQTMHTSSLNYTNKKNYWPHALITVVLLNLAAIVYFYLDKDSPEMKSHAVNITSNERHQQDKTAANHAPDHHAQPRNTDNNSTIIASKEKTPSSPASTVTDNNKQSFSQPVATKNKPTTNDNADVVEYHELPASIKQQLPAIIISAHVYSSNPLQRSVVINNNFLEEGEYVLDGLVLHEITADGAILNYQGKLFHYGVVSGWQ